MKFVFFNTLFLLCMIFFAQCNSEKKRQSDELAVDSIIKTGDDEFTRCNFKAALCMYDSGIARICRNHSDSAEHVDLLLSLYTKKGNALRIIGNPDESWKSYQKSFLILSYNSDLQHYSFEIDHGLGVLFFYYQECDEIATKYFQHAFLNANNKADSALFYYALCESSILAKNSESALQYLNNLEIFISYNIKSRSFSQDSVPFIFKKMEPWILEAHAKIGILSKEDPKIILDFFDASNRINNGYKDERLKNEYQYAAVQSFKGEYLLRSTSFIIEAKRVLLEAFNISKQIGAAYINMKAAKSLSHLFFLESCCDSAYKYLLIYDSINSQINNKHLNILNANNISDEKSKQESESKNKSLIISIIIALSVFLCIIILLLYLSNKKNKKIKIKLEKYASELENQKIKIEETVCLLQIKKEKLEEKSIALEQMSQKAEKATEFRREFIAKISHDLKTPLNVIKGQLEKLFEKTSNPSLLESLKMIDNNTNKLAQIIMDILTLSKIEAGKIYINPSIVDINIMLSDIYSSHIIKADKKRIKFKIYRNNIENDFFILDKEKVERIIENLVDNAIKYTKHGEVILRLDLIKERSNIYCMKVKVQDTGKGISNEKIEKIFESFVQEDERFSEGTGLGLSIVREFVKILNGELEVQSEINKGSIFLVSIPNIEGSDIGPFESELEKIRIREDLALIKGSILIADDEEGNIDRLRKAFENTKFRVLTAKNGQEAYDLFLTENPEIVLLDVLMPIMDGNECAKKIRETEAGRNILILAITAYAHKEVKTTEIDSEYFNGIINKPFDIYIIYELIIKHLNDTKFYSKQTKPPFIIKNFKSTISNTDKIQLKNEFNYLENSMLHLIKHARKTNSFSDVKKLAIDIEKYAQQKDLFLLELYSQELQECCMKYEINALKNLLYQFEDILQLIKSL